MHNVDVHVENVERLQKRLEVSSTVPWNAELGVEAKELDEAEDNLEAVKLPEDTCCGRHAA
jgi:hypothetical protein